MIRSLRTIVLSLVVAMPALTQPLPYGADEIDGFSVYENVDRLASAEFRGRLSGHRGYNDAAAWIAEMFESWGYTPADEGQGFLLPFPIQYTQIHDAAMSIFPVHGEAENGFQEVVLEPEKDFLPLLYSDSADRTADVVFIGWGIHAPDLGYDDYAGVDVDGKFVMCFRGTPDRGDPAFQYHDEHRTRMQQAKDVGALGLIYIYDEPIANPNGDWIEDFTPAKISYAVADQLLAERGVTAQSLREDLLRYKRPISFALQSQVRIMVESTHHPEATGYNVVGYIEGNDPALRDEVIVIGAHLDHCGEHMGLLFGGADDNASGSAVVVEIARAFAGNGIQTKRSVLFALFGAEEMGLIGSRYLADNFPEQFSNVTAMINFDMVGAGDGTHCGYSADYADMKETVEEVDRSIGTLRSTFPIRELGVRGSDHAAFHAKGIPVLYIVSNGPHLKYHTTGDTIYRLNPHILRDIARIGYLTAIELANR
jgi:hypothetical protein